MCFYCSGEHETSQCVSRATKEITSSQEVAAKTTSDAIQEAGYRAKEQMSEVRDDLLGGLTGIEEALGDLQDFLSWSHSQIMWLMETKIELLTGIHDVLKNPRATQADELYKMGVDSFRRCKLTDALRLLLEARELNPGDYRVLITLGHTYVRMDETVKALECFQFAADYARADTYKGSALLLSARALRCLGQIDEAIETAKQASGILSSYSPAHYELACCIAEGMKGPTATKQFKHMRGVIDSITMEAQVKQLLDSMSKAIKGDRSFFVIAKTDLVFDPVRTHIDGLLNQLTQETRIQAEQGIAFFQSVINEMDWYRALEINPQYENAWYCKGLSLHSLGRVNEALECFDKALEIDPQDTVAWLKKGISFFALGRLNEALECSDKALEINSQYVDAWYLKACAEDVLDQKRDAAMSYRKFIELAPTPYAQQIQAAHQRLRKIEA